jgi:YgiT-type zinc finger domain-containing protein
VQEVFVRIKRAILAGRYAFSEKARVEMEADGLMELDVAESILNAVAIYKRLHSHSPLRQRPREYLYVTHSVNLEGLAIYSKGTLVREEETETYYFLISAKRALEWKRRAGAMVGFITVCPSCGSRTIKKMRRNWTGQVKGRTYVVPNLEYYVCPQCGETVYDR